MADGDYLTWVDYVDTWADSNVAWRDTLALWEDGPLSIKRGSYGQSLIMWAGATGEGVGIGRLVVYADGREQYQVLAGAGYFNPAAGDVFVDGDVPFGEKVQSITYIAGAYQVRVPSERRPWEVLSNPLTGEAINVIGSEISDKTWTSATTIVYRNIKMWDDPLTHGRPEQGPSQQLSFYTTSRADRVALDEMAGPRKPLLLRSPHPGFDDTWFVLDGDRTESRIHDKLVGEQWRHHSWTLRLIERPKSTATLRHVGATLGDLYDAVPTTLGDIAARWNTLGEIAMDKLVSERPVTL